MSNYILDYSPESEIFSLQDTEESIIIVIERKQLEALIDLYDKCIGLKGDRK